MTGELNTARALLKAKNYEGARRIVRKALDENPENLRIWVLRIDIEMEAGEFKEALVLARQVLAKHPDNVPIRESEFYALTRQRKKREAKKILEKFRADFSYHTERIKQMTMVLDSMSERTNKVSKVLQEYAEHANDPHSLKELGIAHHRINDLWTSQRLMLEAHEEFPNDAELNATLAANYFQLGRSATARRYARMALASNPTDRRMALLVKASWLQYWPPFFVITVLFLIFFAASVLFGKIWANIAIIVIMFTTGGLRDFWYGAVSIGTGINFSSYGFAITIFWIFIYFVSIHPPLYNKLFGTKKPVKLKKF